MNVNLYHKFIDMEGFKMSSVYLQKVHKTVYKDFFCKSNLVISWFNILTWWPWIWHGINWLRLKQKIPTKTYCWFNPIDDLSIKFWDVMIYDWITNSFNENSFKTLYPQEYRLRKFLELFIKKNWFTKWFEIRLISENPKWHWFSFSWVLSALLAFWIYYQKGKISKEMIKDYDVFVKTDIFDEINRFAWQIWQCISQWNTTWAWSYVTLISSSLPIVYFNEKFNSKCSNTKCDIDTCRKYSQENFDIYWVLSKRYELNDFLKIWWSFNDLPIDYWIIHFWVNYNFEQNRFITDNFIRDSEDVKHFVLQIFKLNLIEENVENFSFWNLYKTDFKENMINMKSILYLKLLKWFYDLFKFPYDESILEQFIEVVNINWLLQAMIERKDKLLSQIKTVFYMMRSFDEEIIWLCPFNSWKTWWSLLFVTKFWKSRSTLNKVINYMKENMKYEKVFLEYASWRDWTVWAWINLEQDLINWNYSEYVSQDDVLYKSSEWVNMVVNYTELSKQIFQGIVLDKIKSKIYLDWDKVWSKEIHSQTVLIEILSILIDNIGKDIFNSNLWQSSYTKNKNEMLWKIIIPLKNLIKDRYNEDLELTCSWSLTWFYLNLNRKPRVSIHIIQKLW